MMFRCVGDDNQFNRLSLRLALRAVLLLNTFELLDAWFTFLVISDALWVFLECTHNDTKSKRAEQ